MYFKELSYFFHVNIRGACETVVINELVCSPEELKSWHRLHI